MRYGKRHRGPKVFGLPWPLMDTSYVLMRMFIYYVWSDVDFLGQSCDVQCMTCSSRAIMHWDVIFQAMEKEAEMPPAPAVDEWKDLIALPDGLDLKRLCEAAENGEHVEDGAPARLVSTLRQALAAAPDQSAVTIFDKIWRLLMYLRYWHGGQDQHWIKNPRAFRKAASTTHWYRRLGLHWLQLNGINWS